MKLKLQQTQCYKKMFSNIPIECGGEHYAEPYDSNSHLKMPMNALVNIGYILVGFSWLHFSYKRLKRDNHLFIMFSLLAMIYGPIQYLRITQQSRLYGILDQWITLPFFAFFTSW